MLALLLPLSTAALAGTDGDPSPEVCETIPETERRFRPRAGDLPLGDGGGWSRKEVKRLRGDLQARIKEHKRTFKRYPELIQQALMDGELRPDLDEVAAYIAWGAPDYEWDLEGRRCRALLYSDVGTEAALVTTCDGAMTGLYDLESAVDCTRLDAVDARIAKNRRWFRKLDADQQTAVVLGVPQPWMTADDLEVVLGKPVRKRSTDDELVFHDDTGYYEGLTVELVDGHAASFTVPDEQMFTRKGRKQYRKDQRKLARQEAQAEFREARRQLVQQAILITAVAVAAEAAAHAEQQATADSGGYGDGGGYGDPGSYSDSSGAGDYGDGGYGDAVQVERTETYVPPPQGNPDGTHHLVGWCATVFQLEVDLRVGGGTYVADYVLSPLPSVSGEPRSGRASGAVYQDGESVTLEGFATGMVSIADQLVLTLTSPAECIGQQVVYR